MRNVECLYISPETERVGAMHRRFSIKELADMLVLHTKLSDVYMTYIHMLHFNDAHEFISNAHFNSKMITTTKTLELNTDEIINVPMKALMSPLQLMASVAYYLQRKQSFAMSMGPMIKPFDVEEDVAKLGWTVQECSSDV